MRECCFVRGVLSHADIIRCLSPSFTSALSGSGAQMPIKPLWLGDNRETNEDFPHSHNISYCIEKSAWSKQSEMGRAVEGSDSAVCACGIPSLFLLGSLLERHLAGCEVVEIWEKAIDTKSRSFPHTHLLHWIFNKWPCIIFFSRLFNLASICNKITFVYDHICRNKKKSAVFETCLIWRRLLSSDAS